MIAVNDEMIQEFKHQGYLEPLGEDVMSRRYVPAIPETIWRKPSWRREKYIPSPM
ncbi:MAG: hypothetical protein ACLRMZ_10210 [Blautia marasmi]